MLTLTKQLPLLVYNGDSVNLLHNLCSLNAIIHSSIAVFQDDSLDAPPPADDVDEEEPVKKRRRREVDPMPEQVRATSHFRLATKSSIASLMLSQYVTAFILIIALCSNLSKSAQMIVFGSR